VRERERERERQTIRGGMYLYLNFREATRPASTIGDIIPASAERTEWKVEVV
jgi:hypothetical protein